MYPNHYFYIPKDSNPPSLPASLASQSTYYLQPPVYPASSYNTEWGQEHTHTLVHVANQIHVANQMAGGEHFAVGAAATTNNNMYPCRWHTGGMSCGQAFAQFDDLVVHLGRVHDVQGTADRKIFCRWLTSGGSCDHEYRRDGYRRHIGTHVGLSVPCPECDKTFSREDSMRAHLKKKHGNA